MKALSLKELRKHAGISQQQLSDHTGIDRAKIASWETGRANPKTGDYNTLMNYFRSIPGLDDASLIQNITGEVHIVNSPKIPGNPNGWAGVPIYDSPVTAGIFSIIRDEIVERPIYYLPIPGFKDCKFGARVSGDSMYPEIRNGDFVLCKEVDQFIFGDIYLVVTDDGQETVKYVHPHDDDNFLNLVPYNKAIPVTPIRKENIVKIFKVKGVIKSY